jgi:hypothetical protein
MTANNLFTHLWLCSLFLLASCARLEQEPPRASSEPAAKQNEIVVDESHVTGSKDPSMAKTESLGIKRSTNTPESPTAATQPRKNDRATPAPAKPMPPTLDLGALETRLRETDAIGAFTKIALKNQVDDLLDRFRAHYQGRTETRITDLRQPYDMLLLKVLSLVQNRDPALAQTIVASREAIWNILTDPARFATL